MTVEKVKAILSTNGYTIKTEQRNGNDTGVQLRLVDGGIVNVFDNGTVSCQGKGAKALDALFASGQQSQASGSVPNSRVFVVYGHDAAARDQLEAMLRRWGLDPLILDQLPSEGQTIIEKLESVTGRVGFGVVLATPDDEGYRASHEDEKAFRARQNVVLELGMLLAKLGRRRVAILLKQQENMERPSDIQGLIYIPFKDDVKDAAVLLAKEMSAQGYDIDIQRL
jgi:predicted nucleotide-binding protein